MALYKKNMVNLVNYKDIESNITSQPFCTILMKMNI